MSEKLEPAKNDPAIYWILGYILVCLSTWLFFDSTRMTTTAFGYISGVFPRGGFWNTSSMAIIFLPLLFGLIGVAYDILVNGKVRLVSKSVSWAGVAILAVEVLSRVRFHMMMKTTHFLILVGMLACGIAMLLRARVLNHQEKHRIENTKDEV